MNIFEYIYVFWIHIYNVGEGHFCEGHLFVGHFCEGHFCEPILLPSVGKRLVALVIY